MNKSNDIFSDPPNISFSEGKFQRLYTAARQNENRIYTDEEVTLLPHTSSTHMYASEWRVRKRSAERLMSYLRKKAIPLTILEVGCGNGWLSAMLSGLKDSMITGIDINEKELDQARRVFGNKRNIYFEAADVKDIQWKSPFDVIIFAATIQYFPLFDLTIGDTFKLLNQGGEIHILDSHFYRKDEIRLAGQRSLSHYQSIGCGEMADFYFHHAVDSFSGFHHKILFNPLDLKNKLFRKKDLFPWICINAS